MGQPFRAGPGGAYPTAAWFAAADHDGDGRIDRAEMTADAARFFGQIDRNGDGRLTPDEVARYETAIAPEITLYAGRREPAGRQRGGSPPVRVGAGRFSWLDVPEPVAAADADLDRVVTSAEFMAAAGQRFDQLAAGRAALSVAALPRTPQQAALEGPCRPPKRRPVDDWEMDDAPADGKGA